LLNDKEVPVLCNAAWALGAIGPKAKIAVPALMELRTEGDPNVAISAKGALEKIEKK
jgi:hypothetical protein